MRLKKEQIYKLSERILRALKEKDQLIFRVPENRVLDKINDVITADMRAEDDLDGEARKILDKYKASGTDIDERQMLMMIKKQLIKEKKLIL